MKPQLTESHSLSTGGRTRPQTLIARLSTLVVFSWILVGQASAQTTTGSIYGTVTDQTGGVIPNATVSVANTQTGISQTVQSNGSGNYIFPALVPGDYAVTTRAKGFSAETQSDVHLDANQSANTSFSLKVGSETQTVTVVASTTLVDTRESQLGETVDQKRIEDLPLNGRDPYTLVQIVPGITSYTAQALTGDQFGTRFSVNGNRTVENTVYLDGAFDTSVYTGGGNLLPNPDALQEFRLLTANFDAEYGRLPGGVVNAITRSGTNNFHGGVHDYFRNSVLNAKSYFNTSVTPLKQNQFGANFGGPIVRGKAFFFLSYEGLRIVTPVILGNTSVPTLTATEATGDFRASTPAVKAQLATLNCNGVQYVICPTLLDPVAQKLLKYVPLSDPNTHFAPQQSAPANTSTNQGMARIDYQLSKSHQISGTFFKSIGSNTNPVRNSNTILDYAGATNYDDVTNVVLSDVWILSPTKLNTFRPFYTLNHYQEGNSIPGPSWSDLGSTVGIGATPLTPPQMTINGYWLMGLGSGGPNNIHQTAFGAEDTFNWTAGNHTIKFGGSFIWNLLHEHGEYLGTGVATFNGTATGNALADFLEGRASAFRQNNGAAHSLHMPAPSVFAQDDWRITRTLTLDLGLRWEEFAPFTGENNLGTFQANVQSKRFPNAPLGLLTVGDPGVTDGILKTQWKDFAPRVGFAYDVRGNGRTAVRGGFGIFYASRGLSQVTNPEQQPFIRDITINNTPNLVAPYAPGPAPFPYVVDLNNPSFISPITISSIPSSIGFPYVYEYNLTVEQQLASSLGFRLQYVGSGTRKAYITRDINDPVYVPGASTSTAALNSRRPYQPTPSTFVFGPIVQEDEGNASYNSLQATLTHSMSHGFSLLASYVWAKSMDISSVEPSNITLTLSDQSNIGRDRARSDFNVPHRFVASYLWETPPVKRWGFIGRGVLSNWQLNGVTTLATGLPFNILSGTDSNRNNVNTDRPNLVGNPYLPGQSLANKVLHSFKTSAFAAPPAGVPYGNISRNFLTGPGFINTDFSTFKNIPLRELGTIQFRAEIFNIFNTVNLANPNGTLTSPAFGTISALASGSAPRIVQFALRYNF
jgi:hypothetical protein